MNALYIVMSFCVTINIVVYNIIICMCICVYNPGNKITMKLSDDGSGKGAAIVASVT